MASRAICVPTFAEDSTLARGTSVDAVASPQSVCVADLAGEVSLVNVTTVDEAASSRSACIPALVGEVALIPVTPVDEAASSRSACSPALVGEDDLDVPLRDSFFASGPAVGLEPTVSVSSHVGESACPPPP